MAVCAFRGGLPVLGVALLLAVNGCGKKEPEAPPPEPGQNAAAPGSAAVNPANARMNQSFIDATLPEPSDDVVPTLPDITMTDKPVGPLYEATLKAWEHVPFMTPSGKPLHYLATLDTDLGPIDIELKPDVAPNHVRNFVALARVGYYDGLVFERLDRQVASDDPNNRVELVEAGSPIGTGDPHYGSIGYWMRPEFLDQVPEGLKEQAKHEEGAVGACLLDESPATAGCRFYVMLTKAPSLDGGRTIFGKVTRGLDLVRRIASQPLLNSDEVPPGTPEKPIIIRKVTIQTNEVEKPAVAANNQ